MNFFFNFIPKKYEFVSILSLIIMHFKDQVETILYFSGVKLNKKYFTGIELYKFIFLKDEIKKKKFTRMILKKIGYDIDENICFLFFLFFFKLQNFRIYIYNYFPHKHFCITSFFFFFWMKNSV